MVEVLRHPERSWRKAAFCHLIKVLTVRFRVRTLEKAKDPLQGLHIPAGHAVPWGSPGESGAGEEEARSRPIKMDGWIW